MKRRRQSLLTSHLTPNKPPAARLSPSSESRAKKLRTSSCSMSFGKTSNGRTRSGALTKSGKRKMVIKKFAKKPGLPANFEKDTLARLEAAVHAVHEKHSIPHSREELYQHVENLCVHKLAAQLFERLSTLCEARINECIGALEADSGDQRFLWRVRDVWEDHCQQLLTIRSVFLHLDRTYVAQNASGLGCKSLWDMGLRLFRKHLLRHESVLDHIVRGLLALVERERNGESVDRPVMRALVRMLLSLELYTCHWSQEFLQRTSTYFRSEAVDKVERLSVPDYVAHVVGRLAQERQRVSDVMESGTLPLVVSRVEHEMVHQHLDGILSRGFDDMMANNDKEALTSLYDLVEHVQQLPLLQQVLVAYVKSTGTGLVQVQGSQDEQHLVDRLLLFQKNSQHIMQTAFRSNSQFSFAVRQAWDEFVNSRANKPAELIAKYMDRLLRAGGARGMTEEELDGCFDRLMDIFRFIQGKDVFEAFYKKDLAKRLLLGKSASVDTELAVIQKIKNECGQVYTSKLEGMFKDIELSRDLMSQYESYLNGDQAALKRMPGSSSAQEGGGEHAIEKPQRHVEIDVRVLTTGAWPEYSPAEVHLAQDVSQELEQFRRFYVSKHSCRKLTWQHSLSHCVLGAHFTNGKKELAVSAFQAAVLLLWNKHPSKAVLSFQQILAASRLEKEELKRTLKSLACGKVKVLQKKPHTNKEIGENDVFRVNGNFSHKLFRIKINTIQAEETKEEQTRTNDRVHQDRQYQIDACVVRIMKSRKTLSHSLLMAEVFNQLKFPVLAADVKKRIGSLLDRDYMERDEDDPSIYKYVA